MDSESDSQEYRAYRRRWLILFVIVITQITNGAAWLSFSPVANYVADYYAVSVDTVNWQMTQFMIVQLVITPFIMWAVDHWSFRWVVVLGAVLNGLGLAIKGISTWDRVTPDDLRFTITMVGSVIAAIAQPFTLVIPTRFSQAWHPQSERTLSTTLASLSNPIGCMLGLAVTPLYVHGVDDVPLINTVWSFPAILSAVLAVIGITTSHPPTPPSRSAALPSATVPFWTTMKALLRNRPLVVLSLGFGPAIGTMNCVATLLGQMFCTSGYSTGFTGLCGALFFGCGVPGALVLGYIGEKTGKMVDVVKASYTLATLSLIVFCQAVRHPNMEWLVALTMALMGFVGVASYPLALELGVEATYPIDQTYSNSFVFMPGATIGAVLVILGTVMGSPISDAAKDVEICSVPGAPVSIEPLDYTNYYMLVTAMLAVAVSCFTIFFDTAYHRTNRDTGSGSPSDTEPVIGRATSDVTESGGTADITDGNSCGGSSADVDCSPAASV